MTTATLDDGRRGHLRSRGAFVIRKWPLAVASKGDPVKVAAVSRAENTFLWPDDAIDNGQEERFARRLKGTTIKRVGEIIDGDIGVDQESNDI